MKKFFDYENALFIQLLSTDGLNLPGLFFDGKKDKAVIFLHGNGSSSVFYYNDYSLPEVLRKRGISTLMLNNRGAHLIHKLDRFKSDYLSREKYGMSYEIIDEAVFDIEGAINYLKFKGYKKIYLVGGSTGANKIVVYNKLRPQNKISGYVLIAGGDDVGVYYNKLGKKIFNNLLKKAKKMIEKNRGDQIINELLPDLLFSYKSFYDIANPDGNYNVFPYFEYFHKLHLSTKPLFSEFNLIEKPTYIIYGENDEFAWGKASEIVDLLSTLKPKFDYLIIRNTDHSFSRQLRFLSEMVADWIDKH